MSNRHVGSTVKAAFAGAAHSNMIRSIREKRKRHRFSDPTLVPRVKKYLADNVDKTYVDVGLMARALRDRYREYGSRSETGFYQTVEDAYNIVLKSYGLDENCSSFSSDDDSDDLEVLDDGDNLNDRLTDMYDQNKKAKKPPEAEKVVEPIDKGGELIDISSDDSSDGESAPKSIKLTSEVTITTTPPEEPRPVKEPSPPPAPPPPPSDEQVTRKRKYTKKTSSKANQKNEPPQLRYASKYTFEDIGGIDHIMEQVCDLILHMKHPEVYSKLGIKAPRGALLHGPPGTGKTLLAHAIAGRLQLPIISTVATELVGGMSGESEKMIRELFDTAVDIAPCVLFIDEIDSICGNRLNAQKDMERRMVAQLLTSIDNLEDKEAQVLLLAASNSPDNLDPGLRRAGRLEQEIPLGIPTVGARRDILRILSRKLNLDKNVDFNTIAQLTPGFVGADLQALINKSCTVAIKRVFKVLKENTLNQPIKTNGVDIVVDDLPIVENGINCTETKINGKPTEESAIVDVESINNDTGQVNQLNSSANVIDENPVEEIEITDAIVPARLSELNNSSTELLKPDILQKYLDDSMPFTSEQLSNMKIMQEDIVTALKTTKPCAFREGIITVPDITWDDVGSLIDVRRDLQLAVLAPVKYPDQLAALGLTVPSGVLLCGPPGCGKTLLAKAVANEAGINFISVKGPELLNMYVGESERAVRTCFSRARNSAPCVIFFDEFDSLCPKRITSDTSGATRVVNQLLTEMDGVEGREGVFVLAATNRPDIIDPAVLRPGRLDRVIFVGMPLLADRIDILRAITKKGTKPPLGLDVDMEVVAKATEGYTGADLAGLVRRAATEALTDFITGNLPGGQLAVSANHFQKAIMKTKPSVSSKDMLHYEKLRLKYTSLKDEKADVEMETIECMDTV